ncbi:MAG: DTW domain-containing protein [Treponema sp.]|nr:DTW domain-containing protein [Treponema sp.]
MSDVCFKCLRPLASCYCKYIKPVQTKVKFVFLMHPKEAKQQRTGTGRLASLSLPRSEIIMGVDFTDNPRVNELLADSQYYPVVLYPADDAWTSSKEGFAQTLQGKTLLVFIIDATWACAKKMVKLSQNLKSVPKFSFTGTYKSIFTFKREPKEYCISTIESCYYLIKELQDAGIEDKAVNPEPLLDVFKRMILFQIQKENERIASGTGGSHA